MGVSRLLKLNNTRYCPIPLDGATLLAFRFAEESISSEGITMGKFWKAPTILGMFMVFSYSQKTHRMDITWGNYLKQNIIPVKKLVINP